MTFKMKLRFYSSIWRRSLGLPFCINKSTLHFDSAFSIKNVHWAYQAELDVASPQGSRHSSTAKFVATFEVISASLIKCGTKLPFFWCSRTESFADLWLEAGTLL
ncbi:uncharacterized protein LOC121052242 [Rosa chinensis]|uniref:uncharacterized protein LOC121052242 n=1 Tax=Rosa chinensis TaxID=74649 RepID=UPI001AD943B0|nr:uncharacterized protein LOC121052242 [Rosa chinensis]